MAGGIGLNVQPGDDVGYLRLGESELGHAFVRTAFPNNRGDQQSLLIVENQQRADQVRRAGASPGRGAMAAGAVLCKNLRSALKGGGILFCPLIAAALTPCVGTG